MNYLITTGRLTKDCVVRFTVSETPVANFTVATDVGWGDTKHAVFIECSLFGKRAESLEPYLKKGMSVTVRGVADLKLWKTDSGHGANITCNVDDVALQGSKREEIKPPDDGFTPQISNDFEDEIPY